MSRMQLATFTPLRLDICFRRATPAHVPDAVGSRCFRLSAWSCLTVGAALARPKNAAHSPGLCSDCCIC